MKYAKLTKLSVWAWLEGEELLEEEVVLIDLSVFLGVKLKYNEASRTGLGAAERTGSQSAGQALH